MKIIRGKTKTVDLDEFLARPLYAHLSTGSKFGPRDSPVWFLWKDAIMWIIGNPNNTFPARIEQEPRCAIGVIDFDRLTGLSQHVGLRGRAFVEPFNRDRAQRLLSRYLGEHVERWDIRFRVTLDDFTNVFIHFEPETVVARDQSYAPSGFHR